MKNKKIKLENNKLAENLNYCVLLYFNNWKFIASDTQFSLYHTDIKVTSCYREYLAFFRSVKKFLREKEKLDTNCIRIYNAKKNRAVVVHKNEVKGFYAFLNSLTNHVEFIQQHTNNLFYTATYTRELRQKIDLVGEMTTLILN